MTLGATISDRLGSRNGQWLPNSSALRNGWRESPVADAAAKAGMLLRKNFFIFKVFCGYIQS